MNANLRENRSHGTDAYPYTQYRISDPPHAFHIPVHWHDEMELIYVLRGHLLVNVGGADYDLTPGQIIAVNPRQLHLMKSEDLNTVYYTILFPLELISFQSNDMLEQTVFSPLRAGIRLLPSRIPSSVLTPENLNLLNRLIQINDENPPMYQLETRLLLLQFIMDILRAAPLLEADADSVGKLPRRLLEYIRIHYRDRISLSDLATQFSLSPKYLSRYFKETFHLTLTEYIAHLRMSHARELLESTDLSVTDIAAQCGYSGVSFFIRCFTETNGCSPLKYRRQKQISEKQ